MATHCTLVSTRFVGNLLLPWMASRRRVSALAKTVVFTVPRCCPRPQTLRVAEERTVAEVKVAESAVLHL